MISAQEAREKTYLEVQAEANRIILGWDIDTMIEEAISHGKHRCYFILHDSSKDLDIQILSKMRGLLYSRGFMVKMESQGLSVRWDSESGAEMERLVHNTETSLTAQILRDAYLSCKSMGD